LIAAKVAFLLERRRRRRNKGGSSPSLRQIALIVVSAGLAILVIRVATQRMRSRSGSAPAASQEPAPEAPKTDAGPSNDSAPATESPLTDTIQTEMSRRDDAPTPATGAD
jgi:hypothetical protein